MPKPELSLGSWAFIRGPYAEQPWSLERVMDFAVEAGYNGIELSGYHPHAHYDDYDTPEKRQALRDAVESRGLAVSGYAPDLTHVPAAAVDTETYMAEIRKCMAFCTGVRTDVLRVDTGVPPEELDSQEYARRFRQVAQNWQAAAEEGSGLGVGLFWEFEPRFLINKPTEIRRLIDSLETNNFFILFDTSHAYMTAVVGARQPGIRQTENYGIVGLGRLINDRIGHVHIADSDATLYGDAESSKHVTPGEGKVDFETIFWYLRDPLARLPWWTVDLNRHPNPEQAARDVVPFLRDMIEEYSQ